MESLLLSARRILQRHPAPALPFSELHRLLSRERAGPAPDPDLLLTRMRARQSAFRILDPWKGPWSPLADPGASRRALRYRRRLARAGARLDVWVVATDRGAAAASSGPPSLVRLRETLRWLGGSVDAGSPTALARWVRLLGQDRRIRRHLGAA